MNENFIVEVFSTKQKGPDLSLSPLRTAHAPSIGK